MDSTLERSRRPSRERWQVVSLAVLLLLGSAASMMIWGIARSAASGTPDSRVTDARGDAWSGPGGQLMVGSEAQTGDEAVTDGSGSRSTQIRVEAVARVLNMAVVTAFAVLWFRWRRR